MPDCASPAARPGPAGRRRAQGGTRTRWQGAGSPGVCRPPCGCPRGSVPPLPCLTPPGQSCSPHLHPLRCPQDPPRPASSGEVPAGAHLPGWSSALQGRHQRGGTARVTVTAKRRAGAPPQTPRGCTAPCTAGPAVGVPFAVPPEAVAAPKGLGWAQPLVFLRKTKAFLEIKLETRQLVAGSDLFGAVEGCHACVLGCCTLQACMCVVRDFWIVDPRMQR